jgi:hypothetical protein
MAPHNESTTVKTDDMNGIKDSAGRFKPPTAPSLEKETLQSLANTVQSSVSIITNYLKKHNLPEPTFADLNSSNLPFVPELQDAKRVLLEATNAIEALAQFNKYDYIGRLIMVVSMPIAMVALAKKRSVGDC